jgi:hypothetical protein
MGGGLYFMKDPLPNAFARGGPCTVWPEPIVHVGTDTHWVAFTGLHFAATFHQAFAADVRLVVDGVIQPPSSIKVRDHEVIEVLLGAQLGRRRIQLDVDSIRSNGVIVLAAPPVIHGFMEWRLGVEDVRGRSPAREDVFATSILDGDAGWGGFGAWEQPDKCVPCRLPGPPPTMRGTDRGTYPWSMWTAATLPAPPPHRFPPSPFPPKLRDPTAGACRWRWWGSTLAACRTTSRVAPWW